ncbi:hypothetical protein C8R44DRAFT_763206 [Mycena epipterygia]|nr:hypothetical protein C8R44DRAFT_763206 [Mycena epipterygia]
MVDADCHRRIQTSVLMRTNYELLKQTQRLYFETSEELNRSRSGNRRLEQALSMSRHHASGHFSRALDRLPHEILLMVFRSALAPQWLLNGVAPEPPHPQSVWSVDLRMKLSIFNTCKSWHPIGLELFYENVALRRIEQVPFTGSDWLKPSNTSG